MRSARHLKFVALAVFIVMVLIAAVPFWLNRSVSVLLAQSRAELLAQQRLDDILTAMRDAETAQRGFVITGNDVFLEPYERVRRMLPVVLHDAKDKARTDAERATAWRIARERDWDTLRDAEYLAVTRLQADALVTVDPELVARAQDVVPVASLDALLSSAWPSAVSPLRRRPRR